MSAPTMPTDEQSLLASTIAASIATRIAEALPEIQQHLSAGGTPRGVTARVVFRLGMQGEAPAVAELEFTFGSGDVESWLLAPNPQTGSLALMAPPDSSLPATPPAPPAPPPQQQQGTGFFRAPGAGGAGPLGPRGTLEMPDHGMVIEQPPGIGTPAEQQTPAQQQALQAALPNLTKEQQQAIDQGVGGKPAAPSPAPGPPRLKLPTMKRQMLAGEEGIT